MRCGGWILWGWWRDYCPSLCKRCSCRGMGMMGCNGGWIWGLWGCRCDLWGYGEVIISVCVVELYVTVYDGCYSGDMDVGLWGLELMLGWKKRVHKWWFIDIVHLPMTGVHDNGSGLLYIDNGTDWTSIQITGHNPIPGSLAPKQLLIDPVVGYSVIWRLTGHGKVFRLVFI